MKAVVSIGATVFLRISKNAHELLRVRPKLFKFYWLSLNEEQLFSAAF